MRITSKGQVTIPQNVREQMGFLANTEVEFFVSGNKVFLQKAESDEGRGKDLIACLFPSPAPAEGSSVSCRQVFSRLSSQRRAKKVAGMTLLTRDAARYRTYFPALRIIAPD